MDDLDAEIKNKIVSYLKTTSFGASASTISKSIGHNRLTIAKYLGILEAGGQVTKRKVGQAKVWCIDKKNTFTVLAVDDEKNILELIALSLDSDELHVLKARSGEEALQKIKTENPDIILLDLMMPGMSGYDVCKKLKTNPKTRTIPVLILSAKGEDVDKIKGLAFGADAYLTKPFDSLQLEDIIRSHLLPQKKKHDVHPITHLPTRDAFLNSARQRLLNSSFILYKISLQNSGSYKKHVGDKFDKFLVLYSKILKDVVQQDIYSEVGHTDDMTFVIMTTLENLTERIKTIFNDSLPYFYGGKIPEKHISQSVSILSPTSDVELTRFINEI